MLNISEFAQQIDTLHEEGKTALEISKILGLKYHQPIYNYFKKKGWENLSRDKYPRNNKYLVDLDFFKSINTEAKAYILGFIAADGHVDETKHTIIITLKDSDYELLEKIRDAMCSTHPIVRHIPATNPYKKSANQSLEKCSISINGKELVTPLIKMGLVSNKTYTLSGDILDFVPECLVRHFLRGYFDGDGCISWDKRYKSGNKSVIHVAGNLDFLERTFNKYFPTVCSIKKYKISKQCYDYTIQDKKQVLKFLSYIYTGSTIYLKRKYDLYLYAMWSCKTELIAGNSYFIELIEGQSAANPLVKCLRQVQRLADETIKNPFEGNLVEYNSATNAQHFPDNEIQEDEDIVRTV